MGRFTTRPVSSTPAKRRRAVLVALAPVLLAAACLPAGGSKGASAGDALDGGMQSAGDVGYEHAQIGEEYWAGLPLPWNVSGHDIQITKAEFTHVPAGIKVIEYRAFSGEDTDGNVLFARADGKGSVADLSKVRDHAGDRVTVKAKSGSHVYYVARIKVTGPIHGSLSGCRFWYTQGTTDYQQQLDCSTIVRLGPPLKDEK